MSHFHAWPREIVYSPFCGLQQRREFRVPGWRRWTWRRPGEGPVVKIPLPVLVHRYVFFHCWTLGMMSKTTFPLILVFSSLSTDYNYCNHSCYQSRISVHTCQQLLCNKSELSYYIEQSCQMSAALVYTKLSEESWLPPPLSHVPASTELAISPSVKLV